MCCGKDCLGCSFVDDKGIVTSTTMNWNYFPLINVDAEVNCLTCNVIYVITCKKCGMQYVGQTSRKLKDRVLEHRRSILNGKLLTYHIYRNSDPGPLLFQYAPEGGPLFRWGPYFDVGPYYFNIYLCSTFNINITKVNITNQSVPLRPFHPRRWLSQTFICLIFWAVFGRQEIIRSRSHCLQYTHFIYFTAELLFFQLQTNYHRFFSWEIFILNTTWFAEMK